MLRDEVAHDAVMTAPIEGAKAGLQLGKSSRGTRSRAVPASRWKTVRKA